MRFAVEVMLRVVIVLFPRATLSTWPTSINYQFKTTLMNRLILFLFCCFIAEQAVQAQQILSVEIIPAEPTVTDTIKIIITNEFPSGSCNDTITYSQFENDFFAASLHCLGLLTVICIDIDTLVINPLPAGQYNFTYVLSSGYGPPGECTPGFIPDDSQTVSFFVSPPLSTNNHAAGIISAFPNPAKDFCTVQFEPLRAGHTLNVYDAYGRTIWSQPILNTSSVQLNTGALAAGLYFLQLSDEMNQKSEVLRLVKE